MAKARKPKDSEPVTIKLGGEEFQTLERPPIGAFMDMASLDETETIPLGTWRDYLFSLVAEEEEARLRKMLLRKSDPVGLGDIADSISAYWRDVSARPTKPSDGSEDGSGSTEASSQDASSSQGSSQGTADEAESSAA